MTRTTLTVALLALLDLLPAVALSAEPAPLDDELLEYLAEFEDQADNWTWFADDDDEEPAPPATPTPRAKEVER